MIVDKVYKLVQVIASKDEATGRIPDVEFNRLSTMAQSQKLNEELSLNNDKSTIDSDSLSAFKSDPTYFNVINGVMTKPSDYRYFESCTYVNTKINGGLYVPFEELRNDEWSWRIASELDKPDENFPALNIKSTTILIEPSSIQQVRMVYIKQPADVVWGYEIVNGRKVFREDGASVGGVDAVDFTFGDDDIPDLVYRILTLAGVSFREADLAQYAMQQESKGLQI
jgi:hypothetical protein